MNVQTALNTANNTLTGVKTHRSQEARILYDNEGRRMQHSEFRAGSMISSFWELTDSLPRPDQLSLAANLIVNQTMQNGMTEENRNFLEKTRERLSPEDLADLRNIIDNHPTLQRSGTAQRERLLQQIQAIWPSQQQEKSREVMGAPTERPRTPEEIFFQSSSLWNPIRVTRL